MIEAIKYQCNLAIQDRVNASALITSSEKENKMLKTFEVTHSCFKLKYWDGIGE